MIELISYWKIACPKKVIIKPFALDEEQIRWWKKLYFNGLGEFFYVNGIQTNINDFMTIDCSGAVRHCHSERSEESYLHEQTLIPVGGGKDSVVTLELLKNRVPAIPLIVNPRGATKECVAAAG